MCEPLPSEPIGDDELGEGSLLSETAPLSLLVPMLARNHHGGAAELLRPLGLAPGQERLLALLWQHEPRSQAELTSTLGVEAPTVTKMLTRLEQSGTVVRHRSQIDRRGVDVALTDQGRALREPVLAVGAELERRITGDFSEEERERLEALLRRALQHVVSARGTAGPR